MGMKLNSDQETRFSIGDKIWFVKTTADGPKPIWDEVISIRVDFYNNSTTVQYVTIGGNWVYDWSAFASEDEIKDIADKYTKTTK